MAADHVERMKVEHAELTTKCDALNKFIYTNPIFKTLEDLEQVEMIKQLALMEGYKTILGGRIWRAK